MPRDTGLRPGERRPGKNYTASQGVYELLLINACTSAQSGTGRETSVLTPGRGGSAGGNRPLFGEKGSYLGGACHQVEGEGSGSADEHKKIDPKRHSLNGSDAT